MYITYRDELGIVCVEVDGCVSISDGYAYFTVGKIIDDAQGSGLDEGKGMKVAVSNVMEIGTSF